MIKVVYRNLNNAQEAVNKNNGYCPCKLDKNCDTKCTCKEFRERISKGDLGLCDCGLFEIVDEK